MFFDILTLFPGMFEGAFSDSIIKRAVEKQLISINIRNIRDFSHDKKHNSVDDYPYGGDAGMLLRPEPITNSIKESKKSLVGCNPKVVYLTPSGERLNQNIVKSFLGEKSLILLCGRYKGVDQRVIDHYVDREISIGDYVLSGGEVPAMVLLDAITRLIPGVLGNLDSAQEDSFYGGLLSHPQYTRPEYFEDMKVPDVLLSGNHAKIRQWQQRKAMEITQQRRPDLLNEGN